MSASTLDATFLAFVFLTYCRIGSAALSPEPLPIPARVDPIFGKPDPLQPLRDVYGRFQSTLTAFLSDPDGDALPRFLLDCYDVSGDEAARAAALIGVASVAVTAARMTGPLPTVDLEQIAVEAGQSGMDADDIEAMVDAWTVLSVASSADGADLQESTLEPVWDKYLPVGQVSEDQYVAFIGTLTDVVVSLAVEVGRQHPDVPAHVFIVDVISTLKENLPSKP